MRGIGLSVTNTKVDTITTASDTQSTMDTSTLSTKIRPRMRRKTLAVAMPTRKVADGKNLTCLRLYKLG